jgi:intein/homing endonuclease
MKLNEIEKAYLAGFIDGDGCLLAQLVKREDYKYLYEIRITINLYQKTSRY